MAYVIIFQFYMKTVFCLNIKYLHGHNFNNFINIVLKCINFGIVSNSYPKNSKSYHTSEQFDIFLQKKKKSQNLKQFFFSFAEKCLKYQNNFLLRNSVPFFIAIRESFFFLLLFFISLKGCPAFFLFILPRDL